MRAPAYPIHSADHRISCVIGFSARAAGVGEGAPLMARPVRYRGAFAGAVLENSSGAARAGSGLRFTSLCPLPDSGRAVRDVLNRVHRVRGPFVVSERRCSHGFEFAGCRSTPGEPQSGGGRGRSEVERRPPPNDAPPRRLFTAPPQPSTRLLCPGRAMSGVPSRRPTAAGLASARKAPVAKAE